MGTLMEKVLQNSEWFSVHAAIAMLYARTWVQVQHPTSGVFHL